MSTVRIKINNEWKTFNLINVQYKNKQLIQNVSTIVNENNINDRVQYFKIITNYN